MQLDEQYLADVVKPLVAYPEDVVVVRTTDERGVLLTLKINQQDMGRVIGKSGETARSIRRLLRQLGANTQSHISMKIDEPPRSNGSDFNRDDWNNNDDL